MYQHNNPYKKFLGLGLLFLTLFLATPHYGYAAGSGPAADPNFQIVPTTCGNRVSDAGPTQTNECGWSDLLKLIDNIIQFIIYLSAILATLAFCYAGFLYVTAFGESGKIEEAHNIFSTAITGVVIILLAWLIVATILKTLEVDPNFSIIDFGGVQTIEYKKNNI